MGYDYRICDFECNYLSCASPTLYSLHQMLGPVRMQPPLQSFHPPQTRSKHVHPPPAKEDCPSARTGPDRHPSQNNQSRQDKQRHSHKKHLANPVNVPPRQMAPHQIRKKIPQHTRRRPHPETGIAGPRLLDQP